MPHVSQNKVECGAIVCCDTACDRGFGSTAGIASASCRSTLCSPGATADVALGSCPTNDCLGSTAGGALGYCATTDCSVVPIVPNTDGCFGAAAGFAPGAAAGGGVGASTNSSEAASTIIGCLADAASGGRVGVLEKTDGSLPPTFKTDMHTCF